MWPGTERGWRSFDGHCHAWRRWPYAPPVPDEARRGTVEQLLYEMDAHGVMQALVVCAAIENNADNLDYVAAACRAPSRPVSTWSPTSTAVERDLPRAGQRRRLRELADRYPLAGFAHYLEERNDGWLRATRRTRCSRSRPSAG